MKEIVNWLLKIERLAGKIYRKAADFFKDNEEVSKLLAGMAEDEAWHYHVIGSAFQYLRSNSLEAGSAIILDNKTISQIEACLIVLRDAIRDKTLTSDIMFSNLLQIEFSEWNDIFLYVINSLAEHCDEFVYVKNMIDIHIERLEMFLTSYPGGNAYLETLMKHSLGRDKRILLMIDLNSVKLFLDAILKNQYIVDICSNGESGLEMIRKNKYDCIISDIDMPEMNGMDFYKIASRDNKTLKHKMLFISSILFHQSFYDKHELNWLSKPFSLTDIREKIKLITER